MRIERCNGIPLIGLGVQDINHCRSSKHCCILYHHLAALSFVSFSEISTISAVCMYKLSRGVLSLDIKKRRVQNISLFSCVLFK